MTMAGYTSTTVDTELYINSSGIYDNVQQFLRHMPDSSSALDGELNKVDAVLGSTIMQQLLHDNKISRSEYDDAQYSLYSLNMALRDLCIKIDRLGWSELALAREYTVKLTVVIFRCRNILLGQYT